MSREQVYEFFLSMCGSSHPSRNMQCVRDPGHQGKHASYVYTSPFPNKVERIMVEWEDD